MTGFPGLGLLRVLRPIPPASAGNGPLLQTNWMLASEESARWFPRSLPNRLAGSAPNYVPATSPRLRRRPSPWPPDQRHQPVEESPHTTLLCGYALLRGPDPPGSSRWTLLRSFRCLVPHVRLSVLLAGPGPSGSASPFRRCQGWCAPSPSFQGSGWPQLQRARCDEHGAVASHHRPVGLRLVA